tara:strand:+ start:250 stop:819 length:570 start_codon:yes stop_codon:yes gene_type:complete
MISVEPAEGEALFVSTREALVFAFNYADQQYAKSPMGSLYAVPGSGRGLTGVYGAGEAGMIMAEVMRLKPLEGDALCVRYTGVRSQCNCCGHEVDTSQVRDAIGRLIHYAAHQSANTGNLSLVRAIVRDYFGLERVGTAKLMAEQQDVHRNTVSNHSGKIKRALRMLERQAEKNIDRLLQGSGKVASEG